jgi:hypothetical protein
VLPRERFVRLHMGGRRVLHVSVYPSATIR